MSLMETYLADTVTLVQENGSDQWGTPLAATKQDVRARVKMVSRRVLNCAGVEVMAAGRVFLANAPHFQDRIRVDGTEHAILRIDHRRGWSVSHYEVAIA